MRRWSIARGPGDFMPLLIGCVLLLASIPPFVLLLWVPDPNSGTIAVPMLILLGLGILIGCGFVVLGLQLCAFPGSLVYQLAHGRIFLR